MRKFNSNCFHIVGDLMEISSGFGYNAAKEYMDTDCGGGLKDPAHPP